MRKPTIPDNPTKVKPSDPAELQSEICLSKTAWRFYDLLSGCRNLYSKENKLHPNGSFFKSNSFFEKRLGVSRVWVQKIKKILKAQDLINYTVQPGRGIATSYWILDTPLSRQANTACRAQGIKGLDAEKVTNYATQHGKERAQEQALKLGYTKAQFEACFDRQLKG